MAHIIHRKVLRAKQQDFEGGLREPSAEEIASQRLSPKSVQKLYKARVDAYTKYMELLEAVVALEGVLGIVERWTARSQQYQDAVARMAERDWRRALDRLEYLMVQRMFELAKSHTFGTGTHFYQGFACADDAKGTNFARP